MWKTETYIPLTRPHSRNLHSSYWSYGAVDLVGAEPGGLVLMPTAMALLVSFHAAPAMRAVVCMGFSSIESSMGLGPGVSTIGACFWYWSWF